MRIACIKPAYKVLLQISLRSYKVMAAVVRRMPFSLAPRSITFWRNAMSRRHRRNQQNLLYPVLIALLYLGTIAFFAWLITRPGG